MSRDTKRTWSETKEAEEIENDHGDLTQKMKPVSQENLSSRKKTKPNIDFKANKPRKPVDLETDPTVLQRRQKQIDYGKNTVGYANFTEQVPIDQRTKEHPKTPDKYTKYSRRGWDMLIKIWRKKLHEFDKDNDGNHVDNDDDDEDSDDEPETF